MGLSVFVCLGWLCFVNLLLPSPVVNVTQRSFFHLLLSVLFAFCRQDKHLNPLDLPVTVSSVAVWKGLRAAPFQVGRSELGKNLTSDSWDWSGNSKAQAMGVCRASHLLGHLGTHRSSESHKGFR